MGCDIHFHSEIKYKGKWEHYGTGNFIRNYFMFFIMAGVRGNYQVKPFRYASYGCDIPDDCSVTTKLDWTIWEADAHSGQVYDKTAINEFYRYFENLDPVIKKNHLGSLDSIFLENTVGWLFGNGWDIIRFPFNEEDYDKVLRDITDVRWIFWFDN